VCPVTDGILPSIDSYDSRSPVSTPVAPSPVINDLVTSQSDIPAAKFILTPHAANSLPTLTATISPPTVVQFAPALASNNASVTPCPNLHKLPRKVAPTVATSVVDTYPHDNNNPSARNTIHSNSTTPNDKLIIVTQDREISLVVEPQLTRQDAYDAVHSLEPNKLTDQLTSLSLNVNDDFEAFEEFHSYILDHLQHPSTIDFYFALSDWLDDFLETDAGTVWKQLTPISLKDKKL